MAPLLLAFDTSGPLGSVALGRGGDTLGRRYLLGQASHASGLVPAIHELLEKTDASIRDVDGLVVGQGPGSFTGVRVAAATAKGLAFPLDLPVWAPSSLAGAAASGGVHLPGEVLDWARRAVAGVGERPGSNEAGAEMPPTTSVGVLFDARADRFYAGGYHLGPGGWECVWEPCATTLPQLLAQEHPAEDLHLAGDGALKHRVRLEEAGFPVLELPWGLPTADGLLRLLDLSPEMEPLADVGSWEPTYLRGTGARPLASR